MSLYLLISLVIALVLAMLMNWRLHTGWGLGVALVFGMLLVTFGGAALIGEMTNGRVHPEETMPWLALVSLAGAAVIVMRRSRSRPGASAGGEHRESKPGPAPAAQRAAPGSLTVFLSYRRTDSQDVSGRIYDRLIQQFGAEQVFKDVDSIPLGVDFRKYVGDRVARCDALLAVIGPGWVDARDESGRRLDDPRDLVRAEVAAALARDIPVVPVLVGGAQMPAEERLPGELRDLSYRNGIPVRPDPDFHKDVSRLIEGLEAHPR